ncbi:MAG: hypothetical protein PHS81_01775 [Candidatus Nanoarchaeia archaeon]|nr:hypothetical protein [Candidatus Nanoarchaeia archaeon]
MNPPKIDLKELEKERKRNFKERLKMVEEYAKWLKRTDNKTWSKEQAKMLRIKKKD